MQFFSGNLLHQVSSKSCSPPRPQDSDKFSWCTELQCTQPLRERGHGGDSRGCCRANVPRTKPTAQDMPKDAPSCSPLFAIHLLLRASGHVQAVPSAHGLSTWLDHSFFPVQFGCPFLCGASYSFPCTLSFYSPPMAMSRGQGWLRSDSDTEWYLGVMANRELDACLLGLRCGP